MWVGFNKPTHCVFWDTFRLHASQHLLKSNILNEKFRNYELLNQCACAMCMSMCVSFVSNRLSANCMLNEWEIVDVAYEMKIYFPWVHLGTHFSHRLKKIHDWTYNWVIRSLSLQNNGGYYRPQQNLQRWLAITFLSLHNNGGLVCRNTIICSDGLEAFAIRDLWTVE